MKPSTILTALLLFAAVLGLHGRSPGPGLFENERSSHFNPDCPEQLQSASWLDLRGPGSTELDQPLGRVALRAASGLGERGLRGTTPESWHRWSALLQALSSLALYWVLCSLGGSRSLALLGALLFGLHPMLVESVSWVSMSARMLASLWALLAIGCWSSRNRALRLLGLLAACLALGSHPIALGLGPVLLAISAGREERSKVEIGLSIGVLLAGIAWLLLATQAVPDSMGIGPRLLAAGAAPMLHLRQALIPFSSGEIHMHPQLVSGLGGYVLAGWVLSAFLIALGIWLLKGKQPGQSNIGVGIVWFTSFSLGSALLPYSPSIASDSDGYLALAGLVLAALGALLYLFRATPKVPASLAAALGLLAAGLGYLSLQEIEFRKSEVAVLMRALDVDGHGSVQEPGVNALAHSRLGLELFWHGDLTSADGHLAHALSLDPGDASAWIGRAAISMQRDEKQQAREFLLKAQTANPEQARAWERMGELNLRMGSALSNLEAIANMQRAVQCAPDFVHAFGRMASLLSIQYGPNQEHDLANARDMAQKAIDLEPNSKEAWKALGAARVRMGEVQGALDAFGRSLEIEPDYSEALAGLAKLLRDEGLQPERALRLLERTYFLHPLDANNVFELASAYREVGDFAQAEELYRVTLGLNRQHRRAHEGLGWMLLARDEIQGAIQEGEFLIGVNTGHPGARLLLGEAYQRVARYTEAITCLKIVSAGQSGQVTARSSLALLLAAAPEAKDRDGQAALRLAKQMLSSTQGKHVDSLRALAAAHAELGNFERARQQLERALALGQPEHLDRLEREAQLYAADQPLRLGQ